MKYRVGTVCMIGAMHNKIVKDERLVFHLSQSRMPDSKTPQMLAKHKNIVVEDYDIKVVKYLLGS